MSQELRIRDSVPDQTGRGGDAERSSPDPGEAAWDLPEPAEPGFSLAPLPVAPQAAGDERDEPPLPFAGFPGMGGDEEEEPPKGPGLDLQRLVRGIVKRLWLALGIALAIASLFQVAASRIKPKWEASASVILHTRQDKFSLGGTTPYEMQNYNVKTLLDTIKLPTALQEVYDTLKLKAPPGALGPAINATITKDSNIFPITVVWDEALGAVNIANTVAKLLVERSRDRRREEAAAAYANYSEQVASARTNLSAVTDEMRAFKASHQVVDFKAEIQVLLGSLSGLETDLNTKMAEVQAYKETLAEVEKAVKGEPEMVVTSSVYRNPLKNRLSEYEWQLQEARSRYTEQNPKVIKLQTRVDTLKQMITESKDEGAPENLYSANIKLKDLLERRRGLTNDIRIREAQIAALTETLARNRTKLAALSAAEKDFQLLLARMMSAENLVTGLVGRLDEAEIMKKRNESAFEVLEPARTAAPVPTKKKLIAIAGVVLGGGIGLAVVLVLELLDPLVRTRRDALGIAGIELAWEFQQVPVGESAVIDRDRSADPVADLFRRLLNELDTTLEPEQWRCLGVSSADPAAGRTLIATNLAQALALKEYPMILVDADLRALAGKRPAALLGLPASQPGLLQALRGEAPLTSLVTVTGTPDLALLTAGDLQSDLALERRTQDTPAVTQPPVDPDPDQLATQPPDPNLTALGSRQFRATLDTLRQTGRHLVYDLPPIGAQETVLEAAASLGNLLLVARSGQTTRTQLREAVELLDERGAKVHGILVTDVPPELLEDKPLFPPKPDKKTRKHWFGRAAPQAPSTAAPDPQPDPEPHAS
ncbi:hypothetical protein [uncultured Thiodictyon sp.]|uniref:GumC family protein n=1 Tax=uncultured Thiodictyon sp. TaxID=1846217 RepID=UPI0025F8E321|nr:hypothetical protein [uncultured Thiodictyon sp.]